MKLIRFGYVLIAVFCYTQFTVAQTIPDETLKKITFDQKLGSQLSLETQFFDEDGHTVKLGKFFGKKPVILVLGYYGCPMLCTFVLNGLIGSLQNLDEQIGDQFEVVNVSIDPTETTALAAAKKKSYLKRYGRPGAAASWHFLTGDERAIHQLAAEVGFNYAYDARIQQYAHPSGLVILTAAGKVSHYLSGVVYSPAQLKDAIADAATNKVGSPIRELFLLCFHYSPITGKYGALIMAIVRITGLTVVAALAGGIMVMIRRERKSQPV